MKVVVDTSVVFSALVCPFGTLAELLLNPIYAFQKYSCYYQMVELFKHKERISKISQLPATNTLETLYLLLKKINYINESQISSSLWQKAYFLTHKIDEKDIAFVALTLHIPNSYLWTCDKILAKGLIQNGFSQVVDTQQLLKNLK